MFDTAEALNDYYQSTLRNIGLTTSIVFAVLSYSRFHIKLNKNYFIVMYIITALLLIISFYLNYYLYNLLQSYKNNKNYNDVTKLDKLNILFFIIHVIIILFMLHSIFYF